jgi:hypothetical protein
VPLLAQDGNSLWVVFSVNCEACKMDEPRWADLRQSLPRVNTALRFIGVDSPQDVRSGLRDHPLADVVLAPSGFARALRITRFPFYMLVAPDGTVEWAHYGTLLPADEATLLARAGRKREGKGDGRIFHSQPSW